MNEKQAINKIVEICKSNEYVEVCGFLGFKKDSNEFIVEEQENISDDPSKYFLISPVNYLLFKDRVDDMIVFHSHINGDEKPSEFDVKVADNCCDPFLIYSLVSKKIHIFTPQYSEVDVSIIQRLKEAYDNN